MPCRAFHDQLVNPRGKIAKLLRDYVCIRIADLTGVDIGLFEFDPDSTLYCFILNADEQIYMRFGGRDDESAETFLNAESLEIALERGLEQHEKQKAADAPKPKRPDPFFPRDYPDIKNDEIAKGKCVHCHHLGQAKTKMLQSQGKLDRMKDMWIYPDIKRLGLQIDPEKGLEIDGVEGVAKDALNKHPMESKTLKLTVLRKDEEVELELPLGKWWRVTDIARRAGTHALEPFPEFWGKELDKSEKRKLGIKEDEFGLEITKFWVKTNAQAAGVQVGDVVYAVDDLTTIEYTTNPTTWIRLNKDAGDTITVKVLRNGKKLEFSFKLKARPW